MAVWWASALSVAESYLTSEVRDSGPECQAATAQEWPAEATSCLRPGAVTLRSHPEPEARAGSREEQPDEQWLSRHRKA